MFRGKSSNGRLSCFMVFLVLFASLVCVYPLAEGAELQARNDMTVHGSSHGAVAEGEQGEVHGADRRGDLIDLLYRIINFTLLIVILWVAIRKSGLKDSLAGRIDEIKRRLEDLKREKEEAEGQFQALESKLREFEAEKGQIIAQFRAEGEAEKGKIIAEGRQKAKLIVEQAELSIRQEMQSAKDSLKREVMDLAALRAQEIIAKEMTEEDQDRLVDEFIAKVGKRH